MRRHTTPTRSGFTLIELLVVISIIGALAALTAGAVFRLRAAQTVNSTEATLSKIHLRMAGRWSAIIDQAKKDVPTVLVDRCGGDKDRATALWTYAVVKNEFPMTFAEAKATIDFGTGAKLLPRGIYLKLANDASLSSLSVEEQSATLIYAAIAQAGNKGVNMGMEGLEGQTAPLGTATVFKDSWGSPVIFLRHASGGEINGPPYTRSGQAKVAAAFTINITNMLDPLGKLSYWTPTPAVPAIAAANNNPWLGLITLDPANTAKNQAYMMTQLRQGLPTVATGFGYIANIDHTQNTIPTLISAGPNKKLGIYLGGDDDGNDNLLSYRLRKEGDRGN